MRRYTSTVEKFDAILSVLEDNVIDHKGRKKKYQIYVPEWYWNKIVKEIRSQARLNNYSLKITRRDHYNRKRVNFIPFNKIMVATYDWHESGEVYEEPIMENFETADNILK